MRRRWLVQVLALLKANPLWAAIALFWVALCVWAAIYQRGM
jgi:hypothetical protein